MIDNFVASAFVVERVFKDHSAYLIKQGTQHAVLKGDVLATASMDEVPALPLGQAHGDEASQRERLAWVESHGGSPQVKKSVAIMADIIGYVTGESSLRSTRVLSTVEVTRVINRLKNFRTHKTPGSGFDDPSAEMNTLAATKDKKMVWYLLPCFENIRTLGYDDGAKEADLAKLLVKHQDAFESLGRIMVCDMFFGNYDRLGAIAYSGRGTAKPANQANIFLTWNKKGKPSFLGIDFLDTQMGDIFPYMGVPFTTTLSKVQERRVDNEYNTQNAILNNFDLLKVGRTVQRNTAARFAADAIATAFNKEIRPVFGAKAQKAARTGMHDGRSRLEKYFKQRINVDKWPRGLESRFRACGW